MSRFDDEVSTVSVPTGLDMATLTAKKTVIKTTPSLTAADVDMLKSI